MVTSVHGDGTASPPYSPRDKDMYYLLSHSQQSLTGGHSAPVFLLLLLLHWVFTGIYRLSYGLLWNTKKISEWSPEAAGARCTLVKEITVSCEHFSS